MKASVFEALAVLCLYRAFQATLFRGGLDTLCRRRDIAGRPLKKFFAMLKRCNIFFQFCIYLLEPSGGIKKNKDEKAEEETTHGKLYPESRHLP